MKTYRKDWEQSILVLVPVLNEEEGIGPTLTEFTQYLDGCKFLVVDGKSKDQTAHVAKSLGADVLYQEGTGKGDAIRYAIQNLNRAFDYFVFTDGDYTYPAEVVPRMIDILEENPRIGMVCGNRFGSYLQVDAFPNLFYFGNRIIGIVHNLLNGISLSDPLTGLRVTRGEIIKDWKPKSSGFDIEVELNHHVERQGYSIAEIDIPYRKRLGQKKLKMKDGLTIFKRILLESAY